MSAADSLTLLFALFLLASLAVQFWLSTRQMRHVAQHRAAVPVDFADKVSLEAHQKAADYTVAKGRVGLFQTAFASAVLLGWTLLGGLDALNQALLGWLGQGMAQQVALVAAFGAIGTLIDLPFALHGTFVLEERFGFNRMTWKLWLTDFAKDTGLTIVIGIPIVYVILWLMGRAGAHWWIWAWAFWSIVSLLAMVIYPLWIAPLYNKFVPIEDEAVKARVGALLQSSGLRLKGLFVMDGSKRSGHSNAYFTGVGMAKRVVFFDTLLEKLSAPEMDAVLAHELGHYRHKHLAKMVVVMFAFSFAAFALLGWLSTQAWFYTGLGVQPNLQGSNDALALLLFTLAGPAFGYFASPLFAQLSRRHEFEADAFASKQTSGKDLGDALLKLYDSNASTLTPDPVYVKFYYSHPPASERIPRLRGAPA